MFNLKKRRVIGDNLTVFQYMKECQKAEDMDLFSKTPKDKTRISGWKLKRVIQT